MAEVEGKLNYLGVTLESTGHLNKQKTLGADKVSGSSSYNPMYVSNRLYRDTCLLTPWSRVLLEKLTVSELVFVNDS